MKDMVRHMLMTTLRENIEDMLSDIEGVSEHDVEQVKEDTVAQFAKSLDEINDEDQ